MSPFFPCFNETPGENSPASYKMLQPSGCSCAPRNGFGRLFALDQSWQGFQAITPNKAPTPAVKAMAKAAQKGHPRGSRHRRSAAGGVQPEEPNSARKTSELPETAHMSVDPGTKRTIKRGTAAPTEKVIGRRQCGLNRFAVDVIDIPSSSRPCAPRASCSINWVATLEASPASSPRPT